MVQLACFSVCVFQLSVDDISVNADVYGDSAEHSGNFDQLKVCFCTTYFHDSVRHY